MGDNDGVLVRGDGGMLCQDLRRLDGVDRDLCFKPCSELGRLNCEIVLADGEFGPLDSGEPLCGELPAESDPDDFVGAGGDLACDLPGAFSIPPSPDDKDRLN